MSGAMAAFFFNFEEKSLKTKSNKLRGRELKTA